MKVTSTGRNGKFEEFLLLNLILLLITQPGSIAFANFDAPYGFVVDLTTWISSFIGLSPVALGYLLARNKKAFPAYLAFIMVLSAVTYVTGFWHTNFPFFLIDCFVGALLSLVILPVAVLHLREVYRYSPLLGRINLIILLLVVLLLSRIFGRPKNSNTF